MSDTAAEQVGTCPAIAWNGYSSYTCGKPIKRGLLCGAHAAAQERRQRNDAARAERKSEARAVVDRLAAHGVSAYVDYDGKPQVGLGAEGLADHLDSLFRSAPGSEP